MAVGLKALLSASVCISLLWTFHAENHKKHHGEPYYWVQLGMIASPQAKLKPVFQPDTNDYDLIIDDGKVDSIQIALELMIDNYYPDEPPKIQIDGKALDYNPFQRISFDVPTNQSIGELEKTLKIRVSDPKSKPNIFGQGKTENTYKVRLLQAPIYSRIVVPTSLTVKDPSGRKLDYTEDSKRLTPESAASSHAADKRFTFSLPDKNAQYVEVELGCPDFPSVKVILDGENSVPYEPGSKIKVPMLGSFRREVQVECMYEDERWADYPLSNAFSLVFSTHIEDSQFLKGRLVTPSPHGSCEKDDDLTHERWADYKGAKSDNVDHGFICRVVGQETPFLSLQPSTKVLSELTTPAGLTRVVKPAIEVDIPTANLRSFMTYTVRAGDLVAHYPVLLLRPDNCTSLPLPPGNAYDYDIEDAKTYMCHREECHMKVDEDHCFTTPRVTCEKFTRTCPDDTKPHSPPEKYWCMSGTCDQWIDDAACCQVPHPKGEAVIHHDRKAVVYWADRVGVKVLGNIVYEDTCGTLDHLDLNEVKVNTCPTFINGEWVFVHGKHGTIIGDKPESGSDWLVHFFDSGEQQKINCQRILKDAEWWLMCGPNAGVDHRPIGMERIESSPADSDIEVIFEKDRHILTTPMETAKAGVFCPKDFEVTVDGAKGKIEEDCGGDVRCTIKLNNGGTKSLFDRDFVTLRPPPKIVAKANHFEADEEVQLPGGIKGKMAEECSGEHVDCKVIQSVDGSDAVIAISEIVKTLSYKPGQQVFVGSRRGTVSNVCSTDVKCKVHFAGSDDAEEFDATELVTPTDAFRKGEVVFMRSRRGMVQEACGLKQTCRVKLRDVSTVVGELPATWLARRVPFHKGSMVQTYDSSNPTTSRIGTLTEVCDFVHTCKVKFGDEDPEDAPADTIFRLAGMYQGQEVVLDGRLAVTTQACGTCEKCKLMYMDDLVARPEIVEVPYSRIIHENALIYGTPVITNGEKGWVRRRLPGNQVTISVLSAADAPKVATSPTTDSNRESKFIQTGEAPPWHINVGSGTVVRLVDPFVPRDVKMGLPLVVGDRVICDGKTALVSKRHNADDTYDIIFQDTRTVMRNVGRSVLQGEEAAIMVGDSVFVDGEQGVIAKIVHDETTMPTYQVRFNSGQTSQPLPKSKVAQNEEWRELGARVVVKGRRGRIESLNMELGAYYVVWTARFREVSGPLKPWQLCASNENTGLGGQFAPGDETLLFGEKGVVVAGPDDSGSYRVTLFASGDTILEPLLIDSQFMSPVIAVETGHGKDGTKLQKDDRVMCLSGACKGKLGTLKAVNPMGTASVLIDNTMKEIDKVLHDLKKIGSQTKTYSYGEIVTADKKSARIELGPDNLGNYMVRFDDGQTGGPYKPADFAVGEAPLQRYSMESSDQVGSIASSSDRLLQLSLVCSVASMALFLAAVVVHRRSQILSHRAVHGNVEELLDE